MNRRSDPQKGQIPFGRWLPLGIGTGVLLGLFTSLSPVVALIGVGLVAVMTALGVRRRDNPARSVLLAGTLLGAGATLLFGAINTVAACMNTDDFCGQANVWAARRICGRGDCRGRPRGGSSRDSASPIRQIGNRSARAGSWPRPWADCGPQRSFRGPADSRVGFRQPPPPAIRHQIGCQ